MRLRNAPLEVHIAEQRPRPLVTAPHSASLAQGKGNHIKAAQASEFFNSLLVVRAGPAITFEASALICDEGLLLTRAVGVD